MNNLETMLVAEKTVAETEAQKAVPFAAFTNPIEFKSKWIKKGIAELARLEKEGHNVTGFVFNTRTGEVMPIISKIIEEK